jgi:uncharacterized protein (TIGR02452 family)
MPIVGKLEVDRSFSYAKNKEIEQYNTGLWGWLTHLFGRSVWVDVQDQRGINHRLYVPLSEVFRLCPHLKLIQHKIGRAFANALKDSQAPGGIYEPKPQPYSGDDVNGRIEIFHETVQASLHGYRAPNGSVVRISPAETKQMQKGTKVFHECPKLENTNRKFETKFSVVNQDSLYGARDLLEQGERPLVLNLANGQSPGGGVKQGSLAQEEDGMRSTNYSLALFPELNPDLAGQMRQEGGQVKYRIPETGAILTPGVFVIRDRQKNYAFLDKPFVVDMLASAAYNLNAGHWGGPRDSIGPYGKPSSAKFDFEEGTKQKMRTQLTIAANAGYTSLVLGAFGCGAFLNPPEKIAMWYKELLNGEFRGLFKTVRFSVLGGKGPAARNFEVFAAAFQA